MKKFIFSALSVILIVILSSCNQHECPKRVIMVFSYHPEYSWVEEENEGVMEVFKDHNIEFKRFYMDTKRKTSAAWKQKMADSAMQAIQKFKPDVIMLFDDNACEYVGKQFINKETPVVFCGMNADPSVYGFPAKNITGEIERFPFIEMISFLKELSPKVKKVAFISDDSPTGVGIEKQLDNIELPVETIEIIASNDFETWKSKIGEWQETTDAIGIITYHTIIDTTTGQSMDPDVVLDWIISNSNIPEFSSFDFAVKQGALCGVYISGNIHGKVAAETVIEILNGKSPGDIPVKQPKEGIKLLNKKRAEQLGLNIPENPDCEVIE